MHRCTYLLPIRRVSVEATETAELGAYFQRLGAAGCEVLVNGKVNGIHTGVDAAGHERIIVADDDVRYTAFDVRRMCALLDRYEVVRPQNYLAPRPWWARMEAARMLVNRGVLRAGDYPGTCGVRRTALRRAGPWDGDVLFDNEEMLRHLALSGARVAHAVDFFVRKRPTTLAKWREQRPRQAYEDFGMRTKTWLFAALIPALLVVGALAGARLALGVAAGIALVAVALALRGRRDGAARFVPAHVALWAPLWAAERAVSTWWALYWRLRHGGYPFGDRRLTRGTGRAWEAGGRVPVARDRAA